MKNAVIDITLANKLKQLLSETKGVELIFRCKECDQPVSAHVDGQPGQGPHFEHLPYNPKNCAPKKSRQR
jgi:hypothetical protein